MDEARRIRFLVPPFFFMLSVTAGLYFSEFALSDLSERYSTEELVAFGAVIGASILPIGFLLTSLSILVLRAIFGVFGRRTYEAALPTETWELMWPLLRTNLGLENQWHLYAVATFDHELLEPGIHEWLLRRWTTFNLSVHSFTAVLVAHLAAFLSAIDETWPWGLMTVALLLIFGATAWIAWLQTMRMLKFQTSRMAKA